MISTTTTRTCTEVIVEAMEHVDEMESVIVVYRLKGDNTGVGWMSNLDLSSRIGVIEEAKFGMFEEFPRISGWL